MRERVLGRGSEMHGRAACGFASQHAGTRGSNRLLRGKWCSVLQAGCHR